MKDCYKKIFVLSALLIWLALPAMASAQANPNSLPTPPPEPAQTLPSHAPRAETIPSHTPTISPEQSTNSAENINVELKIPLPFVSMNCETVNAKGVTVPAVCSLADYLEGIYRLLIGLGALLAVVMIIIAGYQWMAAGGSADQAGAAKKRVWGASMGLVLALVSYIVLNAISSRLVDLTLPQIKPIQSFVALTDGFCQSPDMPPDKPNPLIKLSADSGNKDDFLSDANNTDEKGNPLTSSLQNAECGHKYYVGKKEQPQGQCMGGKCVVGSVCILGKCMDAYVYGKVTNPILSSNFVTNIKVYKVCGGPLADQVGEKDFRGKLDAYRLERPKTFRLPSGATVPMSATQPLFSEQSCILTPFKGYVLKITVDDGFLGVNNQFIVGHNCSKAMWAFKGETAGLFFTDITADQLISQAEIDAGYRCDLILTDPSFADFD